MAAKVEVQKIITDVGPMATRKSSRDVGRPVQSIESRRRRTSGDLPLNEAARSTSWLYFLKCEDHERLPFSFAYRECRIAVKAADVP